MPKTKVAIIGCGRIACSAHIPAYAKNPLSEIKVLVDIREERAIAQAQKYGIEHTAADFRVILDDPEIEAVSICTPNDTHAPIAIACLEAGKHVLCEKPASVNLELVRMMKDAAARYQRILNIGVVNCFNTQVNKIKDLIDGGELGKLYHIYCSFRSHRSIPGLGGPFTTRANSGGGVLIDWGVHFLDLIFYCIGQTQVSTVSGVTHSVLGKDMQNYTFIDMWAGPPDYSGTYDVEDFVSGLIRTSGPTISLNGAWAQNIGELAMFIEFLGEKAGIKLKYGGDFTIFSAQNGMLQQCSPTMRTDDMFYEEIDGFIKACRSGEKNRAHIDRVLITSEVMEAIYRSSQLGKEVCLD